jgi:hypothetical protein
MTAFVGTYTRPGFFPGSVDKLTITPGGMAMEQSGMPESMIFSQASCYGDNRCRASGGFCEVEIVRQEEQRIVVTANMCSRWAGVWTLDKDAPAVIAPPPSASGSVMPSGSAAPSAGPAPSASAAPAPDARFDKMIGSYARPGFFDNRPAQLMITKIGAIVEDTGTPESVKFERVTCDGDEHCVAEGPSCRADMTRQPDGKLVVIAGAECHAMVGVWSPAAAGGPGGPSPAPSTWSPAPGAGSGVGCLRTCNEKMTGCAKGCGQALDCLSKCSDEALECAKACGP